jgi:phospholipase/carboxylesterase
LSIFVSDPKQPAKGCVIWMHGLGADANDMIGLADELPLSVAVRHVFLNAPVRPVTLNNRMPMRAWYDILGMTLTDKEDQAGISFSETVISEVLEQQAAGFAKDTIFLAGFSQGGAMALYTGLNTPCKLGGIVALSSYLPLATQVSYTLNQDTPVFIASGDRDPLVLPVWTRMAVEQLHQKGYRQVEWHRYAMEHSICREELIDLGQWMSAILARKESE